jgi:hypothetical protein
MLSVTNRDNGRCARWCALVVLLAVCSLTISVATRYSSPETVSNPVTKTLQKQSSEEPGRQRLTKNAATWMPPIVVSAVFYIPCQHPKVVSAGRQVPNPAFVSSLYYRPPPSSVSL